MKVKLLLSLLVLCITNVHTLESTKSSTENAEVKTNSKTLIDDESSKGTTTTTITATREIDTSKEKRQIASKETPIYPNHRSESSNDSDDPEIAQETIYGPKPNEFIIRPISPHQHQQHESHQEPQIRNYAAVRNRPHAAQLLQQSSQSQETPHYVYLQDVRRNQQSKAVTSATNAAAVQGKSTQQPTLKKSNSHTASTSSRSTENDDDENAGAEEAEQRYAIAVQAQQPRHQYKPIYQQQYPQQQQYLQQQPNYPQQQPQYPQQQQQYQIIPEEQFLRFLEAELHARAYQDAQDQQQHQIQRPQPQPQPQTQQAQHIKIPTTSATQKVEHQADPGLGSYRERFTGPQEPIAPAYGYYDPAQQGGPRYFPLPPGAERQQRQQQLDNDIQRQQHLQLQQQQHQQQQQQQHQQQQQLQQQQQQLAQSLPPQIAYYRPQISYKTLPNHPLAKSSLESEIEKLLAANKPSSLEFVDTNEPNLGTNSQHVPQRIGTPLPPLPTPPTLRQRKTYSSATTPNSLLDANNQPFIPSLFKFSNYEQPTPIYPTHQLHSEKKQIAASSYIPSTPSPTPLYASPPPLKSPQFYLQDAVAAAKSKLHRPQPFGNTIPVLPPKQHPHPKSALIYNYERAQQAAQFYPSPPDPIKTGSGTPSPLPTNQQPQPNYPQYLLPQAPSPSQSSIYVSQGTGLTQPSRPASSAAPKPKTVDDVKQLHLPPPGGKPLTQTEFQALLDAGYPLQAVPVPVPIPFEQYVKDHPEYRNHPPTDYAHLMRLAARQFNVRTRSLALASLPSEPSVKIVSSPSEQQSVSVVEGDGVTYLRPIEPNHRRNTRDEKETSVAANSNQDATK